MQWALVGDTLYDSVSYQLSTGLVVIPETATHVADDFVHTGTDTLWELGIVDGRRVTIPLDGFLVTYSVEVVRCDPRFDVSGSGVKDFASKLGKAVQRDAFTSYSERGDSKATDYSLGTLSSLLQFPPRYRS